MIAAQSGKRPEKVKQEMAKDGSLASLYVQMREQKAVDKILETAEIEEVDVKAEKAGDADKAEKNDASAAEASADEGGEEKKSSKRRKKSDAGEEQGEGEAESSST